MMRISLENEVQTGIREYSEDGMVNIATAYVPKDNCKRLSIITYDNVGNMLVIDLMDLLHWISLHDLSRLEEGSL